MPRAPRGSAKTAKPAVAAAPEPVLPGAHWTINHRLTRKSRKRTGPVDIFEMHADGGGARGRTGGTQTHNDLAHYYRTGEPAPNEHAFSRALRERLETIDLAGVRTEVPVRSPTCMFWTPVDFVAVSGTRTVIGETP